MVSNLPADAGDKGSISGSATATEAVLRSPGAALRKPAGPRACDPQQEQPSQCEARAPQPESSPHAQQLDKSPHSNEDSAQPKTI